MLYQTVARSMENYQSFVGFVGYEYLIKAQNT